MIHITEHTPFELHLSVAEMIGSRERQEDAYLVHDSSTENRVLIALADGLGGHCDGHIASETAVRESVLALRADDEEEALSFKAIFTNAFLAAHRALFRIPHDYFYGPRPATTLIVCAAYRPGEIRLAGIGDSLAWIIRRNVVHELLLPQGSGHVVNHALGDNIGTPPGDAVAHASWPMQSGDRLLMASDGLLTLSPEEIVDVINANPENAAPALIAAVKSKQLELQDNCVAIVLTARRITK